MKTASLLLSFSLLCAPLAGAATETKFIYGVNLDSGWYDVNKTFDGDDDDLCWAAAASNVIKWWQNSLGVSIPSGTPQGNATGKYSSDIFETFANSYVNDGGDECDGFTWWLTGYYDPEAYAMKPGYSEAGFWKNIYPDADIFFHKIEFDSSTAATGSIADYFSSELIKYVSLGCGITFGIETGQDDGHALTMWGFDIDSATNTITSIYITDSDDVDNDGQAHMDEQILSIPVEYRDNKIYLNDERRHGYYIMDITFYGLTPIPEPATATLAFIGSLLVISRRRK